jgi:predicted RNase H-like HicB family nuclease
MTVISSADPARMWSCRCDGAFRRLVFMRFTAAVSHEGAWYVARCLEVEVTSQAESFDEALVNLREALELYFEDQPLPESVEAPIIAPVDIPA